MSCIINPLVVILQLQGSSNGFFNQNPLHYDTRNHGTLARYFATLGQYITRRIYHCGTRPRKIMYRGGYMLNCSSLNTSVIATSKARVYTVSLDQILSTPGWSSASTFATFCNLKLLMLIMILQKMFEICRLGYYCVIDTLQLVLCCRICILH